MSLALFFRYIPLATLCKVRGGGREAEAPYRLREHSMSAESDMHQSEEQPHGKAQLQPGIGARMCTIATCRFGDSHTVNSTSGLPFVLVVFRDPCTLGLKRGKYVFYLLTQSARATGVRDGTPHAFHTRDLPKTAKDCGIAPSRKGRERKKGGRRRR